MYDTDYILIDHIIGSFNEEISILGKPKKKIFDSLHGENRMPELNLLKIVGKQVIINFPSEDN